MSRLLPILFNTEMVRAILDGRKTVTRRVMKNQDYMGDNRQPYRKGDILYVRETWSPVFVKPKRYLYKVGCDEANNLPIKWHPSIHMPKEAARIWLRVTDVRVERLQDITEREAEKEGFYDDAEYCVGNTARGHFSKLWDSTIKKTDLAMNGWNANPYVWVIEFERCEKPQEVEDE